jgi:hypothetical protein
MSITNTSAQWLMMVFSLPSSKASERVQIWRKLQKFGAINFRNAGYLLPNTPENQERFAWICTAVRGHKGEASVLQVESADDVSPEGLRDLFRQAREIEYAALRKELQKQKPQTGPPSAQLVRLRKRFDEIVAMDFFGSKSRSAVEQLLNSLTKPQAEQMAIRPEVAKKDYQSKTWMTRSRPGIDRVSSAWLITRFIDPKARFIFADDPTKQRNAIPFDMYGKAGFGHESDRCTFETLCRAFGIGDKRALLIAEAIHDADLEDGKFGRHEGHAMNQILRGWAAQHIPDDQLLRRGIDLIEGFYNSIPKSKEACHGT